MNLFYQPVALLSRTDSGVVVVVVVVTEILACLHNRHTRPATAATATMCAPR